MLLIDLYICRIFHHLFSTMNLPRYLYASEETFSVYEFTSIGPKGPIKKIVQFDQTSTENVFNLAFGDADDAKLVLNDLSISNNGDSSKVLATVGSIVNSFMEKHPNAWIFATGSTAARTRLYRMGIANNLEEITADYVVFGLSENGIWSEFMRGKDYNAFLFTKKGNIS